MERNLESDNRENESKRDYCKMCLYKIFDKPILASSGRRVIIPTYIYVLSHCLGLALRQFSLCLGLGYGLVS